MKRTAMSDRKNTASEVKPQYDAPDGRRLIGYARVSTSDQNLAMQTEALLRAGCLAENIHSEHVSGVAKRRPKLRLAIMDCREGDTFVVWKLDRLGRSLRDLLDHIKTLEDAGVGFKSLTEGIDTTTPGGKLIMHVMGSLAQFERDLVVERTTAGVRAHIARGGKHGREAILTVEKRAEISKMIARGDSIADIAKHFGVSTSAVRTYFRSDVISALRGGKH
jgi:DNA invertase Pin-like site-specific DNA recombinase